MSTPEPVPREGTSVVTAGHTEQGPHRGENQDELAVVRARNGETVLVAADGMGGHAGGGAAARAAVQATVTELMAPSGDAAAQRLGAAIGAANRAVDGVRAGIGGSPGTTMVQAWIGGGRAVIANVGDSRAYLIRGGAPRLLTADHSWVSEQVRAGLLPAGSERHDPRRNIVTRALLGDPVEADITECGVGRGDIILLCTDGLWEPLEDDQIADLLGGEASLTQRLEWLVGAAIDAGSRDNLTAVAAEMLA